ncbi:DUF6242 domain-containing protein [Bacteroides helcogenes]|uniref:Lipoprotein n=1 Tax=Bacteroides helcogenes (strain ATCC 35417 / DSM 20613 / JCM 6297 / CCUG 15421 / P 36-108) TaxID=693979 RepID=E6SUD2_BACT6|nr:DUF6242 domain-containing protein [Bacteroides helcogenes]ADV42350.1 hypothetical protein Bache_0321 [Bacteroides helcogenes P 36-108]MDY5237194.1 DUF6242 domain-containing protein [Bacteroides helcogenes]
MRIKFLSVIVVFLIVSIALSSCLKSDDNYELSSDAIVHAFGIDTIHGKYYKFTIDQLNRLIYNKDSLPVGSDTIIDRILIDTMTVSGWITSGLTDTLFLTKDSVNLLPAMNNDGGMKFKIHAPDGVTTRDYTLKVNVHMQDPDSLVWKNMKDEGSIFSNAVTQGTQRSVILNNELLVYTSNTTAYKTSTELYKYGWSELAVANLPSDAKLTSVINFQNKLYMITESGELYSSTYGATWEKGSSVSPMKALIACFPKNDTDDTAATMVGIHKSSDGTNHFCTTKDGITWSTAEKVPDGFPMENIYSTILTTANGVNKAVVVGMPSGSDNKTTPWFSMNGEGWASLATTSNSYYPGMTDPSIMYYGGTFYGFGGELDAIYSSVAGIAWYKTKKKFLLPAEFKNKGAYSMTIDKDNFIWIVFGGNNTKNEVWRGRLNRLGFKEQ